MSPPAQNALPSPLRIATRISEAASIARAASAERVDHRPVEGVELVGAPEREARQRPVEGEIDVGTHRPASSARRGTKPNGSGWNRRAVHRRERFGDAQGKAGLIEHVALEIDAGSEFDHRDALALEPHHASLGDVENLLPLRHRAGTGERDLLDRLHQLLDLAFPFDPKRAALDFERRAGGEISGEHDLLRSRRDVDEAAGARP